MQVSQKATTTLHSKLPIDEDEKILAVYKHHWFAYASSWIAAGIIVVVVMALAIVFTTAGGTDSNLSAHRGEVIAGAGLFSVLIVLGAALPVYLRSQEQLVLTEESLLQVLQPSLFASKVDSVGLARIDDVSVRQNFLGTILGFGHITVETPGEQDNYEFYALPNPHDAAREITRAHENFEAALNAGRIKTTMGEAPVQAPQVDMAQYEQFLQYQQMVASQQAAQSAQQQSSDQAQLEPVAPGDAAPPAGSGDQPPSAPAQAPAYPPSAETGQGNDQPNQQ